MLERTGIAHLRDAYPQHCAAAKKQRVAIASALAMQSKILILDRQQVVKMVRKLKSC